jgi:hypothetical protein
MREAEAVKPWTDVRQVGEYGANCPQANPGSDHSWF